jgi:hypothetical protein
LLWLAGYQWLTPVIPTTQEAEIYRIMAKSQLWANSSLDPILKKYITKKSWRSDSSGRAPDEQA